MASSVTVATKPVTRDLLAQVVGNHRVVKLLENLGADVSKAIPDGMDGLLGLIDLILEAPASAPPIFEAFPVGGVFVSTVATDPSQLLGYGVWSSYAAGQVLVGFSPGDPAFGMPGGTGGAKTAAISAHAGAAVADHADHTHQVNVATTTFNAAAGTNPVVATITPNPITSAGSSAVLAHSVTQPNNHTDVSIVQPYMTVYFWLRTA